MSETTRTLPALLAVLAGVCLLLVSRSPVGLFVMVLVAVVQYLMRNQPLGTIGKLFFVVGAGALGALGIMSVVLGFPTAALLCGIESAFCTSVLYTRMKV
jgi:hypothetical protein